MILIFLASWSPFDTLEILCVCELVGLAFLARTSQENISLELTMLNCTSFWFMLGGASQINR